MNRRETHLRIRRCLSSYGIMRKRPNVVRSLGWDPGYHEVIRNGPENKIHIRKVPFRSSGMIPVFSSENFQKFQKSPAVRGGGEGVHECVITCWNDCIMYLVL